MSGNEEIRVYDVRDCRECILGDGVMCNLYERHLYQDSRDGAKPEWCLVDTIKIEFGG